MHKKKCQKLWKSAWQMSDYVLIYRSCPQGQRDKTKNFKIQEKVLDKLKSMWYHIKVAWWKAKAWSAAHNLKNFEKLEKSSWQVRQDVLRYKSSQRTWKWTKRTISVPCKLNNVKTNYNTLDNYMDCLRIVYKTNLWTANENSWVYLLRQIYSKDGF